MLSYNSFARKTIKWWKKLFFHLFDLVMVNALILHNKSSKKKMSLEIFYEKVTEGLLTSAGTENQTQGQNSSPAGRLVGRDHFYTEFQLGWSEHLSAHATCVHRETNARPEKL
jgi:hypothetical protein